MRSPLAWLGLNAALGLASPATAGPVLVALVPDAGPTTGLTRIAISGVNLSPTDEVIFSGPALESPPLDFCDDGQPVCINHQCALSEARGACTLDGVAAQDVFRWVSSSLIEVITPSVGRLAAGLADVMIRASSGDVSNVAKYEFFDLRDWPPTILRVDPSSFSGPGCCGDGQWQVRITGSDFRKCSSVILSDGTTIYELLPTVDVPDCSWPRGGAPAVSPRDRLRRLMPPDGGTLDCSTRPDLVPLRAVGGAGYLHDWLCRGGVPVAFCPALAMLLPAPDEVTTGGAFSWVSSTEIRLLFAPAILPACGSTITASLYVSNDPGRGLSGDFTSNSATLGFTATGAAPPLDLGNALLVVRRGLDVQLHLTAGKAESFRFTRDGDRYTLGQTALGPDTPSSRFLDANALLDPDPGYYRARGVNCGSVGP